MYKWRVKINISLFVAKPTKDFQWILTFWQSRNALKEPSCCVPPPPHDTWPSHARQCPNLMRHYQTNANKCPHSQSDDANTHTHARTHTYMFVYWNVFICSKALAQIAASRNILYIHMICIYTYACVCAIKIIRRHQSYNMSQVHPSMYISQILRYSMHMYLLVFIGMY